MSQDIRKILAKNVKEQREKKKLKMEQLALNLEFDNSYISKLEKGKINITLGKLEKLANYFGVEVSELLKDKG